VIGGEYSPWSALTVRTSPTAPSANNCRITSNLGRKNDQSASMQNTPWLLANAAISAACAAFSPIGFSTSACFPASSASRAHG